MNQPGCLYKIPGLHYRASDGLWYPHFEDSPDCEAFISSVNLALKNLSDAEYQEHGNGD